MSFEKKGMKAEKMEINLESILPSLAKNLYGDDWRIAIRELLQNCHDALAEAQLRGLIAEGVATIKIIPNPAEGTLTFEDNGIGMSAEGVREHLATVGAGSKRQQLERMSREGKGDRELLDRLIGQYGIGFLSSFIIADRVEVLTRSLEKPDDKEPPGVRALFTGETQWYSKEDTSAPRGTRITLQLKKEPITDPVTGEEIPIQELLNFERLKEEVRRFGDILPYPIHVHRSPEDPFGEACNTVVAPWEREGCSELDLLGFLRERHTLENEPLSPESFVFLRDSHGVEAHGILYFPRPASHLRQAAESVARVELFCRRMFISHQMESLLPDWASFVGAVVECPDLTPILNRNDVIRHAPEFVALKNALGQAITTRIKDIARRHPQRFKELRDEHGQRLYAALLANFRDEKMGEESFFREVIAHLPFMVIDRSHPQGTPMTLCTYREEARKRTQGGDEKFDRIFYLPNSTSIGQYRAMVLQKDLPVIEALHPVEPVLLDAYGKAYSAEVAVEEVSQILDLYVDEVNQTPYEPLKQFLSSLDGGGPEEVRATRFSPAYVPAIALVQKRADDAQAAMIERFVRDAGGVLKGKIRDVLRQEVEDARHGKVATTVLINENNPVIRAIRDHCANGNTLTGPVADVLHEIYHVARAYTDPRVAESEHYFDHRNKILDTVVRLDQTLKHAEEEQTRAKLRLQSLEGDRDTLRAQIEATALDQDANGELCKRNCVLLVTDLRGSTRMVGFLDRNESTAILRDYAERVQRIVEDYGGRVEKFTGDGIFGTFELTQETCREAVQRAYEAAAQIQVSTNSFFNRSEVNDVLQAAGGIQIQGCRTVLHYGEVVSGNIAGSRALVGPQVVAAFRANAHKDLFKECSTVLSAPFHNYLSGVQNNRPIATAVKLDDNLPAMDFFPHPGLARPSVVAQANKE